MAISPTPRERTRVSSLFDVRTIIGALLGIYGVVLVLTALISDTKSTSGKSGDTANLWVGIVLLLASAFFLLWARLRPVVVRADELREEKEGPDRPGAPRG